MNDAQFPRTMPSKGGKMKRVKIVAKVLKISTIMILIGFWGAYFSFAMYDYSQGQLLVQDSENFLKLQGLQIVYNNSGNPSSSQLVDGQYSVNNASLFAYAAFKLDPPPRIYENNGKFSFYNVTCIAATPMAQLIGQCDKERITELDYTPRTATSNLVFSEFVGLVVLTAAFLYVEFQVRVEHWRP